jgi:choline kinase
MARTTTAVVLVAGVGSRLRPLTDDRPKALVEVGGVPLLLRSVRVLRAAGVEHLILATGYREAAVQAALADCAMAVTCCLNPAFDRTQNSVSLALCESAVGGKAFFKLDGDVLFELAVLERLESAQAELAVAVDERRALDAEAMKVTVDGPSIAAFGKAIAVEQAFGESIGIERVAEGAAATLFAALRARIDGGETQLYYEDIYSELIGAGRLRAVAVAVGDLPWTEIDDHSDLEQANEMVASGRLHLPA